MIVSRTAFLAFVAAIAVLATASRTDSNNEADAAIASAERITDILETANIPNYFDGGFQSGSMMGIDANHPSSGGRELSGATIQSFADPDSFYNRKCGQVFDVETNPAVITGAVQRMILTADAIFNNPEVSGSTYDDYFGPAERATGRSKLSYQATNGIKAMKICAKCSDYRDMVDPEYYDEYDAFCGSDAYGGDATLSGLALIPVNARGRVLRGSLKGTVWWRVLQTGTYRVPSSQWYTTEEGGLLGAPDSWYGTTELLGGLMTAGSGQLVIMPDGIGYGESADCYKGVIIPQLYKTATVPLYFAAQEMIAETTNCRSELSDVLSVSGFSEGGYASIAAAEGLTSVGLTVTKVRSGSPIINPKPVIETLSTLLLADRIPFRNMYIVTMLLGAYSSTVPGLPNSGDLNQSMLSEEGRLRMLPFVLAGFYDTIDLVVLSAFALNTSGSGANAESINLKLLNPAMVEYAKMGKMFCENPDLGPLCESFDEASIENSIYEADYPISVCFSPLDDTIPFLLSFPGGQPLPNTDFFIPPNDWGYFNGTSVPAKNFYGHPQSFGICTMGFAYDIIDNESMRRQPMTGKCANEQGKWGKKNPNKKMPV
eukprot:CAMPEP_0185723180 /NCGR_PEP_ID=MMETSP1171-20130828/109_1 /TAXON_ID=374046 /ORGANISM="Helicotheca tamensis, Strain CCMP826" /LENGTH=600 /DNA_ID=CAMNT_0028390847 /DNA_START=122 /DNA_END=1924 /DNA_ORIENTATION=-